MNLYGFAAGDPVSFSDPFGLCPDCPPGDPGVRARQGLWNRLAYGIWEPCLPEDNAGCHQTPTQAIVPSFFGGPAGAVTGRVVFGATSFRGLTQNRRLVDLTHNELAKAFAATGYKLSTHANMRLRDARTAALGVETLSDVARLLNKGVIVDLGEGVLAIQLGRLQAVVNATTKVIVTFSPIR